MRRSAEELASLSRLLDAALDLPPHQRAGWIDSLDAANEAFKPTLRQMLSHADPAPLTRIGSNVEAAVLSAAKASETPLLQPGGWIGSYSLIRELGRGGMGAVWLARRSEGLTRREVALKLPHPGLFHAELAQRIARERDILEGLAHPHIARLYDAGITSGGQPYLAIEYVEGTPINLYCESHRLDTRARIELLQQVLGALQYAHSKLVLHRDLKPANILVTDSGQAMLLDFGIAKLMIDEAPEDSALTRIGGRALTPDYASPEQIAGLRLSTSSDVYSLGVLMYELFTGVRPYDLSKSLSLQEALAQTVISRPSSRAPDGATRRALQGDLDTIVLKALKPSPAERYATVAALAEDLNRHLRGDPVLARPDTAWYRLRKFSGRNKLAVGAVAAVIAALAAGLGIALAQTHKAQQEARRAEQVKSFVLSMLDSADSDAGAGAATTAVDLLQAARKRVENELAGEPAIAVELMTAVGFGLLGQDRAQDAADLLDRAVQLSMRTGGADDPHTLEAQVVYGEALYDLGRIDEAITLLTPLPARARRLHAVHAEVDAWRVLSNAQLDAGDQRGALASVQAAVAALPPVGSTADRQLLLDAKQAHLSLANVLSNLHQPGVSKEARLSLDFARRLGNPPDPATLIDGRTMLGIGLVREGQPVEGLRELNSTYADMRRLRGADHRQALVLASMLGTASLEAGDVPGALRSYQDSYEGTMRHQEALGAYSVAWGHFGLAAGLAATLQNAAALPHSEEAVRVFTASAGAQSLPTLRARSLHALLLTRAGRFAEAEREFALVAAARLSGDDLAVQLLRTSELRLAQARFADAVSLATAAVDAASASTSSTLRARSQASLGAALLAAGRPRDATAPLRLAVSGFDAAQIPQSPERAAAVALLQRAQQAAD